ncbi:hypothetical protein TCAL_15046 [Tigriopus californicus]|uniref:CD80-like immunoglobulin C2-set domain-containing protein n=1 Tax=Tigriopus californicus TaxID=6832 RepID=A0A553NYM3_TIGCA|nr:uncharacterized protein LOC131886974 [Tigriopus californicus]TRY70525.1 hypothetical protein TCAL_15046 [Tigriopus californicus]
MKQVILSSLFYLWTLPGLGQGFDLVDHSPETSLHPTDSDVELFCLVDEPYTFCSWRFGDHSCHHAADNDVTGTNCKISDKITWNVDGTKCGIVIAGVSQEERGQFTCSLTLEGPEVQSLNVKMSIDVAFPSEVAFTQKFEDDSDIGVIAGDQEIVGCHASDGFPKPSIRVALGVEPDTIDEENDVNLVEAEVGSDSSENDDGTINVVQYFKFTPTIEDCGHFIKCEAVQYNPAGEVIFESGPNVIARKIKVLYPPQPLQEPLEDLHYSINEPFLDLQVVFMASPAPSNNQVIWNINPGTYEDTDSTVIQAGDLASLKYEAFPLNSTGHTNVATLRIFNPTSEDAEYIYNLEATNGIGENKYNLNLVAHLNEEDVFIDQASQTSRPDYQPSDEDDTPKTAGMASGSIAGICIVIVLIIIIIVFVIFAKRKNKCCFAKKQSDPEKNPEAEAMNTQEGDQKKLEPDEKVPHPN